MIPENVKARFWHWIYRKSRRQCRIHTHNKFKVEYNNIVKDGIRVRHHALNRYFERVEGYDLDEISKYLTQGLAERVAEHGDGKYVVGNCRVTVIKQSIVTVDTTLKNRPLSDKPFNPIKGIENLRVNKRESE